MSIDRNYFARINSYVAYLAQAYGQAQLQVSEFYPNINKSKDARLAVFAKCKNVIISTNFALDFFVAEMLDDKWWQDNVTNAKELDASLKYYTHEQYQQVIKLGFTYLFFSAIESSFRTYVKVVNPKFCDDESIKNIYYHLIKKLKLKKSHRNLLDILRLCRNTTHTNGYHNAPKETIPYKDKKYIFIKGEMPKYFEWSDLTHLMYDVKDLLLEIVKSPEFSKHEHIDDPFAVPFSGIVPAKK